MSTSEQSNSPRSSQSTLSVDPEEVQRAKREIQTIVQQISDLAKSDIAMEQFYDEFLNKVVAALAAVGGAVWTRGSGGFQLTYQINLRETGLIEDPIAQEQHGRLLSKALGSSEGLLVAPHSGYSTGAENPPGEASEGLAVDDHAAANATDFLLVLMPVFNDEGPQGIVEVFQRAGSRPATQRGYLRFLQQVCDIAGEYLRSRRLRYLTEKQSLWEQLESFTRTAHETLDVNEAAYAIANEGRRLIGCDRVSVAIKRGSKCTVEAVSGQDTFDKRSNVVTLLNRLTRAVTKTGEDVWYTGDTSDLAPQVEKAIDAYVDESHTKSMAILPLMKPDRRTEDVKANEKKKMEVIGALVVEQMVDTTPSEGYSQRVDVVRNHSATALANALEHHSLFLMPLWKTLGKATSLFRGKTRWKTIAGLTAAAVVVLGGIFYQADFNLEGDGQLKPKILRSVFARMDGEISEILVDYNQPVSKGQVLVTQRSLELDKEMEKLIGRANEIDTQISSARRELMGRQLDQAEKREASAQLAELRKEREGIDIQIEKVEKQIAMLKVTSPIDGRVITGKSQFEQLTGRPVGRGQELLEVADLSGDWRLDVFMPESRMRFVADQWSEAQKAKEPLRVTFFVSSLPSQLFEGHVSLIETTAEARGEEGNTVLLWVEFDEGELARLREIMKDNPKVGAEVIAKVHCGKRPIGYVYLHDLADFIQSKILFRMW